MKKMVRYTPDLAFNDFRTAQKTLWRVVHYLDGAKTFEHDMRLLTRMVNMLYFLSEVETYLVAEIYGPHGDEPMKQNPLPEGGGEGDLDDEGHPIPF